ncbi:hypothetical protein GMJLKIPL_0214 [Methylobacterium isbiliense]|jgi:hypothetical protein|uniref:Uncharacterized protein n=1 Tax=Methylobacterium isbiliense TaxID=315478 RepID=A0ABQ4S956_9HYPH|nr:hypothetical protein GMJLKIPL_0214 [Methylobacterium isbiliense]
MMVTCISGGQKPEMQPGRRPLRQGRVRWGIGGA